VQFRAFEPGIDVNGQTVWAIVDGFQSRQTPSRILVEEGIGTLGPDGVVQLDRDGWYSQEAWLRAFEKIFKALGGRALFNIGQRIPENAIFPRWVEGIDSGIRSIDVAYHLNHRKAGAVMYDATTETMLHGIGHYGYERPHPHKPLIVVECRNPYPCDFDRGIVIAVARRFEPAATLVHLDQHLCRNTGADGCTYHVQW
jgi:hypothetical protein